MKSFDAKDYADELEAAEKQKAAASATTSAGQKKVVNTNPMFDETDDWDMEDDSATPAAKAVAPPPPAPAAAPEAPPASTREDPPSVLVCPEGTFAEDSLVYPHYLLDLYLEPTLSSKGKKKKQVQSDSDVDPDEEDLEELKTGDEGALEDQIASVEERFPGAVDMNETEKDDGDYDRDFKYYAKRLERSPTQVLRWAPGTAPLFAAPNRPTVPACERCGAGRIFEFQVTSPLIYFLTKGCSQAENDNHLQFATIMGYTCAQHCYHPKATNAEYLPEYAFVQYEEVKEKPLIGSALGTGERADDWKEE